MESGSKRAKASAVQYLDLDDNLVIVFTRGEHASELKDFVMNLSESQMRS